MVNLLVILGPAVLGAVIAFWLRRPLRELGWLAWLGWMLLGAGAPVLLGQLGALVVVDQAGYGPIQPSAAAQIQTTLAAGLAGGLGWAAGALSARFTGRKTDD